jgi:peptide/nickel transport system permease protein
VKSRPLRFVIVLSAVALLAPWLAPYDPGEAFRSFLFAPPMRPRIIDDSGLRAPFVYPVTLVDRLSQRYEEDRTRTQPLPWFDAGASASPAFLIGADSYGRDMLSRLLYGARTSVGLALLATIAALLLGTMIGGVAGYTGGWLDDALMRVADFVVVLPTIYVVLVLRAMLPLVLPAPVIFLLMTGIFALVGWPFVARGVRSIVAGERERDYVMAARSLGASGPRIFARHLAPACGGYLAVQATLLLPAFILAEATLSYVGLGFPETTATWGTMLVEAADASTMTRFPWTLAPALAIFAVVLGANVILRSDKIGTSLAAGRSPLAAGR